MAAAIALTGCAGPAGAGRGAQGAPAEETHAEGNGGAKAGSSKSKADALSFASDGAATVGPVFFAYSGGLDTVTMQWDEHARISGKEDPSGNFAMIEARRAGNDGKDKDILEGISENGTAGKDASGEEYYLYETREKKTFCVAYPSEDVYYIVTVSGEIKPEDISWTMTKKD